MTESAWGLNCHYKKYLSIKPFSSECPQESHVMVFVGLVKCDKRYCKRFSSQIRLGLMFVILSYEIRDRAGLVCLYGEILFKP